MRKLAVAAGLSASLLGTAALGTTALGADGFTLGSPDIRPGGTVPDKHVSNRNGCGGQNISPALSWSGAPAGTRSFALTVYDPDARAGAGWWHWAMIDIPASVTSLPENAGAPGQEPAGAVQSATGAGQPGFAGPCPPKGDKPHRYIFTVYALKSDKLDPVLAARHDPAGLTANPATIGHASFTAEYGR